MAKIVDPHVTTLVPDSTSAEPKAEEIRTQLNDILESPVFHGSKRSRQFLGYVCEKSLSGEAGDLKERTLAVDIFGREPHSDLGEDTIVRVGAREVRKRLAQYYVMPQGVASKVRIDLPPGSYVPEFRYAAAEPEKRERTIVSPVELIPERVAYPRRVRFLAVGSAAIASVLLMAFLVKWNAETPNAKAFHAFWAPVLDSQEPLLLAVGHPIVYHASARAVRRSEDRLPKPVVPMQRPVQLQPNEMDGSDIVPVLNQYVGFGDMVAGADVANMLGLQKKSVRIRLANSVQFADLRRAQTLLIGSLTNHWTMELGQAWRFQFMRTADQQRMVIVDTASPDGVIRQWGAPSKDDGSVTKDYFLVSRIPNSSAGGLVIVAAGVKQFGTEAAGRLLADQEQLGSILRKLPAGWESKNVQVVMETRIIGNTPGEPEPVAWHVW